MPAVTLLAILLQTATSPSGDGVAPPPSTATRATAVRAKTPVVIDGRDDDEVWRVAPAITQFREFQPKEDGDPRFATEADRKSTRLNSSHSQISYAVFCLKKKTPGTDPAKNHTLSRESVQRQPTP